MCEPTDEEIEEMLFALCEEPNPRIKYIGRDEKGVAVFQRIPSVQDKPQGNS